MINLLQNGEKEEFFKLWQQYKPSSIDAVIRVTEFNVHLYFAIYYLQPHNQNKFSNKTIVQIKSQLRMKVKNL